LTAPAARPAPARAAASGAPSAEECRCLCGSLLARWVDGAVELKCRRCKRTLRVPLSPEPPRGVARSARAISAAGEVG
jgi:phage FluMu protein Com